jgi:hypothetical protein
MDHWAPNSGPLVKPRPPAVLLLIPRATEERDAEQRNRSPEMRAAALLFSSRCAISYDQITTNRSNHVTVEKYGTS